MFTIYEIYKIVRIQLFEYDFLPKIMFITILRIYEIRIKN